MNKRLLITLGGIIAFAAYCIDFQVLKKGTNTVDIIIEESIDSIYYDVRDGIPYQNFLTTEGIKSYRLDSIDHIDLCGGSYVKVKYHSMVVPYNWWFINPISPMENGIYKPYTVLIDGKSCMDLEGNPLWGDYLPCLRFRDDVETRHLVVYQVGEYADTCVVTSLPLDERLFGEDAPFFIDKYNSSDTEIFSQIFVTGEQQVMEIPVDPRIKGVNIKVKEYIGSDHDWMKTHVSENGILRLAFDENKGAARELTGSWEAESQVASIHRFCDVQITQLRNTIHSQQESMAALRDLYDSCGGENWRYKYNWWSDLPIYKWQGINRRGDDSNYKFEYRIDRPIYLDFMRPDIYSFGSVNELTGMLPESFTTLMDNAIKMDLSGGMLSGKFPDAITHHSRWPEFGWNIMCQVGNYHGLPLDFTNINLQLPDDIIWNYKERRETSTITEQKKNKLTLVMANTEFEDLYLYIDKYLDYAPKGLGLIFTAWTDRHPEYHPTTKEDVERKISLLESNGMPDDIIWVDGFGKGLGDNNMGNMSLFDENGNLLWHGTRTYSSFDINREIELQKVLIDELDPILKERLGEPVNHDSYIPDWHTSSDYSEDGKLLKLQEATEGKGINIVLLGDGFVDTEIESGGKYETDMLNAMESVFMIEPMASLRKYFNVYTVKVVSPNRFDVPNGKQSINQDVDKVIEYIESAIPDIEIAETHICVIERHKQSILTLEQCTNLFNQGGSFSIIYNINDSPEPYIRHIAGYGIGRLLEEYIKPEAIDNRLDDDGIIELYNYFNSLHSQGEGLNISTTDDPTKVPWAHMLEDNFYREETGVYQGAYFWPYNVWRPSETSIMREDVLYFNAPSREQIYKHVMQMAYGADWVYDYNAFKSWDMAANLNKTNLPDKTQTKSKIRTPRISRTLHRTIKENGKFRIDYNTTPSFAKNQNKATSKIRVVNSIDNPKATIWVVE